MARDTDQLTTTDGYAISLAGISMLAQNETFYSVWTMSVTKKTSFTNKPKGQTWMSGWRLALQVQAEVQNSGVAVIDRNGHTYTHLTPNFHLPAMVSQDKKTTEANARALREMLKRPDNKVCADCKRNGVSCPAPSRPSLMQVGRPTLGLVEYVSSRTERAKLN